MEEAKDIDRKALEVLIRDFLESQHTCVLATCSDNVPRASTTEFFPLGMTLYILTEGGKKIENVSKNRHVSVAIHAPLQGWESVRGLQMTGTAGIGRRGSTIFEEGTEAYRRRRGEQKDAIPDFMIVIKVTPEKVEYIDTALGDKGFKVRQELLF